MTTVPRFSKTPGLALDRLAEPTRARACRWFHSAATCTTAVSHGRHASPPGRSPLHRRIPDCQLMSFPTWYCRKQADTASGKASVLSCSILTSKVWSLQGSQAGSGGHALGQMATNVAHLVLFTPGDDGVVEDRFDRRAECLGAVEDEEGGLGHVEPPFAQPDQEALDDGGVLGVTFDQGERMLGAVDADPEATTTNAGRNGPRRP